MTKPSGALVQRVITAQAEASLNYAAVGHSRESDLAPHGFHLNRWRSIIGNGDEQFRRAKVGIRELRMLNLGWISVVPAGTRLQPDGQIATLVRCFGAYALQVARVIYLVDEPHQFGFAYGTLPEYPMRGEERFTVSFDEQTGDVTYEIYSFSRPASLLARLGVGYLRQMQKRFCRDSAATIKSFVASVS